MPLHSDPLATSTQGFQFTHPLLQYRDTPNLLRSGSPLVLAGDDSPVEELRLLQHPDLPLERAVLLLFAADEPRVGLVASGVPLPRLVRSEVSEKTRCQAWWQHQQRAFGSRRKQMGPRFLPPVRRGGSPLLTLGKPVLLEETSSFRGGLGVLWLNLAMLWAA